MRSFDINLHAVLGVILKLLPFVRPYAMHFKAGTKFLTIGADKEYRGVLYKEGQLAHETYY